MESKIPINKVKVKNGIRIIDPNDICRLCIKETSPLYGVNGKINNEKWTIAEIIDICYRLTVEDDTKICEECLLKLDICYNVRKQVYQSNDDYILLFGRITSKRKTLKNINCPIKSDPDAEKKSVVKEPLLVFAEPLKADETHEEKMVNITIEIAGQQEIAEFSLPEIKTKKTFNESKKILAKYKKSCHGNRLQKCQICMIKVGCLVEHFANHYEIELKCDHCPNSSFDSLQDLNIHLATVHLRYPTVNKCKICKKRFFLKSAKLHHVAQHTDEEIELFKERIDPIINAPCSHCGKTFATKSLLTAHERRMHGRDAVEVSCTICNKKFTTKLHLKWHMRIHSNKRPYICEYCGKGFRNEFLCKVHIRVHTNEFPFHCDDCDRDFRTKCWLRRHKTEKGCAFEKTAGHISRMKFGRKRCPLCFAVLPTIPSYHEHLQQEHTSQAFKCGSCEEKLDNFDEYKIHQKSEHSLNLEDNDMYLPCNHCSSVFHKRPAFHAHKTKIKYKDSSYACEYCQQEFSERPNMLRHIDIIHLKKKDYECDICHKFFGQFNQMRTHRNTHTGEKPFSCTICNVSYGDRSTLCKHNKKHHKNSND